MITNHVDAELEQKSDILKAIGHPVRLCIVKNLLYNGDRNVSEMQDCLCIPQSTVSQHLNKLKQAGIIRGERNKTEIQYTLINEDVKKILMILFNMKEEVS
ncbi:MAG TPA: transcriptional regulator [Eubacteriaceae bacterium]|nr:transcriptional regulator [Eubacteriaceae bacterium]